MGKNLYLDALHKLVDRTKLGLPPGRSKIGAELWDGHSWFRAPECLGTDVHAVEVYVATDPANKRAFEQWVIGDVEAWFSGSLFSQYRNGAPTSINAAERSALLAWSPNARRADLVVEFHPFPTGYVPVEPPPGHVAAYFELHLSADSVTFDPLPSGYLYRETIPVVVNGVVTPKYVEHWVLLPGYYSPVTQESLELRRRPDSFTTVAAFLDHVAANPDAATATYTQNQFFLEPL